MPTNQITSLKVFADKRVLITGDTGFKGGWLAAWLSILGAKVFGLADRVPTVPSFYEACALPTKLQHSLGDVRDLAFVKKALESVQPDYVFHLAAQALVRRAYKDPHEAFTTNTMGTLNMLEALRHYKKRCAAIFITSDKAYDNLEWPWGYRETDALGGKDPYSGSKGAAECVLKSYSRSYFDEAASPVKVAVTRAGNVIGGGDWAEDRIVPDAVRAWSAEKELTIRSPDAIRPWQHVLEPLSGYLHLASKLAHDSALNGEAFNFGPAADQVFTVEELLRALGRHWPKAKWSSSAPQNAKMPEASLLKLNCDKALHKLGWESTLTFSECVEFTAEWYSVFYQGADVWQITTRQIELYTKIAKERGRKWALL